VHSRTLAHGSVTSPRSAEIQDLAVRYGTAWAGRDLDAIMAMHTDDTVFHLHGGAEPAIGRDATRKAFAAALAEWPDIRFDRKRVYIGAGHFGLPASTFRR
jgi:ketosteroid isomerase-like protein